MSYAQADAAITSYEEKYAKEFADIEATTAAIVERCGDDNYQQDYDYIKLMVAYETVLAGLGALQSEADAVYASVEKLGADYTAELASIEAEYTEELFDRVNAKELAAIRDALVNMAGQQTAVEWKLPKDTSYSFLPMEDGSWLIAEDAYLNALEGKTETYVKKTTSTTSSGNKTTSGGKTCAKSGCTNKAVTTGDSVYCATHSNRCGQCGCYIDGDAMYCLSCIAKALYG